MRFADMGLREKNFLAGTASFPVVLGFSVCYDSLKSRKAEKANEGDPEAIGTKMQADHFDLERRARWNGRN
jgi:hypothetical protein